MNTLGRMVIGVGLLLSSLGAWGVSSGSTYLFRFAKGSRQVDLSFGENAIQNKLLGEEFTGDRFLRVKGIVVVGVIDSEGNYSANLSAARDRAESVARFIEQKYSWVLVDGRLPFGVDVEQGSGGTRSVEVRLLYHEVLAEPIEPELEVPEEEPEVEGEVGEGPSLVAVGVSSELQTDVFGYAQPKLTPAEPRRIFAAIKTNLLFDAVLALNVEAEIPLADRWSVVASLVLPAWNFSNRYCLRVLETSVEGRYWFTKPGWERLTGHFVGVYAHLIGSYDVQWGRNGLMGSGYGAGLTYGYAHRIGKNLGLEYSLGVGAVHVDNRSYTVDEAYEKKQLVESTSRWVVAPTRLKVSLVVRIGGQKYKRK